MPGTLPSPDRGEPTRSSSLLRDYEHARFMRKAMLGTFAVIFISTLVYAIPWFAVGLTAEDYNNHMTVLVFLVLAASVSAFGAVYLRDASLRVEQTLLTWTSVHEGLSDLRRREYFFDRIVIECQRARDSAREFTVLALRVRGADGKGGQNVTRVLKALEPLLKESDCMAALGPHEIGALAPRINGQNAPAFAEALRRLVANDPDLQGRVDVYTGWAVFGQDGNEAGGLVGQARERMLRAMPPLFDEEAPEERETKASA